MKIPPTIRCFPLLLIPLLAPALAPSAHAQTLLLDFGAGGTTTTLGPSPDDPINFWNNISEGVGTTDFGQLLDLVSTTNAFTDIDLFMVARFNGSNTNGTLVSTLYPMDATRDSLFGNTEIFNGLTNIFPAFRLASLDPSKTYDFTFYASRGGVTDIRETLYTVTGASSSAVALNVANNVDGTISLRGVSPSAAGEISIALSPGPNNNNANHFTYLGVLQVDTIPEPSTALAMLVGSAGLFSSRRRKN